eukprot:GEMP01060796.1.p1 GENE.GEMP01060796.1~~GEMP01060796.1.p1  ORF type:complete len:150 (+),score=32.16 GEMP01060796.1:116-565(+)
MLCQLIVLCTFSSVAAQWDDEAYPPAPARRVEEDTTTTTTTTTTVDPSIASGVARNIAKASLAAVGVTAVIGAWLYCDYKSPTVTSAAECFQACGADATCDHWNYHIFKGWCDIKSCADSAAGYLETLPDWLGGSSSRRRRLQDSPKEL